MEYKNIYFYRLRELSSLEEQLDWANKTINTIYKDNKQYLEIYRGDIYKYRKDNCLSYNYCVALCYSSKIKNDVIICPLEFKDKNQQYFNKSCINIGFISALSIDNGFVAKISEIKSVSKERLIPNVKKQLYLEDKIILDIVLGYKKLIKNINRNKNISTAFFS